MGKIVINGQEMTKEEALAYIDNENTKISQFAMTVDKRKPEGEPSEKSHEGFSIDQELIQQMSEAMDEFNAGAIKVKVTESPKIMGRTLVIIMADADDPIISIIDKYLAG